jgi:uncharacterized protein (UPF0335 family)
VSYPSNAPAQTGEVDAGQLRAFVERIETLETEIKDRNEDKSAVYGEAKSAGYDPRIIKKVVAIRRQDRDKRIEETTLVDLYLNAIGDAP